MRSQTFSIFLLIFFSTLVLMPINLCQAEEQPPAFYCFVKPPERTSFDLNILANVSCTHFVYGKIPIDNPRGRPEFSDWDVLYAGRDGNIRNFLRLRLIHRNAKFLLGVQRTKPFRDTIDARNVAKGVKKACEDRKFDGVFVHFNGYHLQQLSSAFFMAELAKSSEKMMKPTLGVTAQKIWQFETTDRIRQVIGDIEYLYLDMSVVPSNEDKLIITSVDPLFGNSTGNYEDTIQGTVDKLSEEGIMKNRIVLGLTAGGWRFKVPNVLKISHGDFALERGERIPYQKACKARGTIIFDNATLNEVTINRQIWISSNLPTIGAMGKKIDWALAEKFAGIGINSIYDDDPKSECGTDSLQAHQLVMKMIKERIPSRPAKCNRLCYMNAAQIDEDFPFDNLKAEYCSHLVVDYFEMDMQSDHLIIKENSDELLRKIDIWRRKVGASSPRLILSLGSQQKSSVWSLVLANDIKRQEVADEIFEISNKKLVDGIEISWTMEPLSNEFDKNNLNSLITDINAIDKKRQLEVIVSVTAESSYANLYDVKYLNKTVDLVVLHTHRLHSTNVPYTGHPSPLRATPSMQNQKMSVEELMKHWVNSGMKRSRLAVSLTASSMSMTTFFDQKLVSSPFGQAAIVSVFRSDKNDVKTQHEICEAIKTKSAKPLWVSTADVPYFIRDGQFVSFENQKSAQIKATWASLEGVGLAIHDIYADDPNAICNNRTAFPILEKVAQVQVCPKCIKPVDFRKCGDQQFIVSCSFDLKKTTPLFKPEIIPHEQCTEIVVEQLHLNSSGNISLYDNYQETVLKNLTSMRKKMGKRGIVMSLSCGKSEREFTNLMLDNMTTIVDNILMTMEKYNFSGVQLDCERIVKRNNNIQFNTLVRKLNQRISVKKAENGCDRTLAIRFSQFSSSPSSLYQISQLNKLDHISISTTDKYRIDHSLFSNDSKETSVENVAKTWLAAGMKPSKIVLDMSPMAVRKQGTNVDALTQGKVCETVGNRAKFTEDFETITSSFKHSSGVITMPTVSSIRYKIGYAIQEEFGGIAMRTVNADDYTGICGRGSFPILKSIQNNKQMCR